MVMHRFVALVLAPLLAFACHDSDPLSPEEEPPLMGGNPTFVTMSPGAFQLRENGRAVFAARIAGLEQRLATATLADVLADGNRTARTSGCPTASGVHRTAFCWNSGDSGDKNWYPQGLTASWDASADGRYGGRTVILASWYDAREHIPDSTKKAVRISFVNYDDPSRVTYRHVVLVEPVSNYDFRAVVMHAGGIVWYGDYLYVMDTGRGMRVFDLRHIWRTSPESTEKHIGLYGGNYVAYNYRYVLPQVAEYVQVSTGNCPPTYTDEPLCFSFSGLDRSTTPPSLLVGEYYKSTKGARLVRFPFDTTTNLLAADASGIVAAVEAYRSPRSNHQGAVSYNGDFFITSSRGSTAGWFFRTRVGQAPDSSRVVRYPEDLSYQPQTGRVWSLSEDPDMRLVFTVTP